MKSTVSTDNNPWLTIALIVGAVTISSAVVVAAGWSAWKETERAETEARYRRRMLLRMALLYVACAVLGIAEVISGRAPKESLLGLPIAAFLAWVLWKAATRVKIPPA